MGVLDEIEAGLSHSRLSTYRITPDDSQRDLIARYLWNLRLCEAMYPHLHLLEVGLRNRMHDAIAGRVGADDWYDAGHSVLSGAELVTADAARQRLRQEGKVDVPGNVIASLMFGFWTSLFKRQYEGTLWPFLLREVAPAMPRGIRTRNELAGRFNALRQARNRVFHHEPIWNRDPASLHARVCETLHWVNPALAACSQHLDNASMHLTFDNEQFAAIVRSLDDA